MDTSTSSENEAGENTVTVVESGPSASASTGLLQLMAGIVTSIVTNTEQIDQMKYNSKSNSSPTQVTISRYISRLENAENAESSSMDLDLDLDLEVDSQQPVSGNMLLLCRHIFERANNASLSAVERYRALMERVRVVVNASAMNIDSSS